tara:strand:- start:443 stop:832 length:390 start_codon:yes stop_codon:yes gene_type:complete
MSILDKVQIGNSVQVNLELSKDRLTKEIIDTINASSIGTIKDFRITDGKGIGVILKLSNGKEQWFFENEINILDEKGEVIEKDLKPNKNNNFSYNIIMGMNYEKKENVNDLLNPINFIVWLIVSIRDIF